MPINVNAAPIRILVKGAQGTPAVLYPLSVANQAARLALTSAQTKNRLVVQADTGVSYMLSAGGNPTVNGDWVVVAGVVVLASVLTAMGVPTYANLAAAVAVLGFGEVYYDTALAKLTTTARTVPSYVNLAAANAALAEIGVPYFDTTLDELKTTTDIT